MTNITHISRQQARRFLLLKHGLIDPHRFVGSQGVLDFMDQAGCIQFDPIDVCGKNAELVLQSRVKGFRKTDLYDLLYTERSLLDYFDKNLSIIRTADWPYFQPIRNAYRDRSRSQQQVENVSEAIKAIIRQQGPVSSADLDYDHKVDWYWSHTRLARAALESMYFWGDLVVHHKQGTTKYYDLAENCLDQTVLDQSDPFSDEFSHLMWRVRRRIGAVGLLWNRGSDAWLNIQGLKAPVRSEIFRQLLDDGLILEVKVDTMKEPLYLQADDWHLLEQACSDQKLNARCELIAPLDNLLWDRRLIGELFGFDYKWEIYTPVDQRKYGYYVLPLLYGEQFVARIEAVCDRRQGILIVKNIWYEDGVRQTKRMQQAIDRCLKRFAGFNDCLQISRQEQPI